MSNSFVMGIVGVNVLGAVVLIMTIFTRKSLIHYLFSIAWAACGLYAFFADNFLLKNLELLPFQLTGDLIFPILIVLFGISLLADALKKKKRPFLQKNAPAGGFSTTEPGGLKMPCGGAW